MRMGSLEIFRDTLNPAERMMRQAANMNDVKFNRLFLGLLIGAGFLILIGTTGTDWYGMERPATRLGELSKVVSIGGSLVMVVSFGFYVIRTRHSRRAMQTGPFNATEGVRVMSG